MFQSTRWRLPVNLVCRGCVGDDGLRPPAPSFTTCWSLARNGSLVRLSPIVDTVNTRLARGIEIEEHPPLSRARRAPRRRSKSEFPEYVTVGYSRRWLVTGAINPR